MTALAPLYAILDVDAAAAAGQEPLSLAGAFLRGGATLIQIRAKQLASAPLLQMCRQIVAAAAPFAASIIINDRVDVAVLAQASGVHVGQTDLPVAAVRTLLGGPAIVGLSTHTPGQIDDALRQDASYIAVGPVFGTRTKDTGYDAVGLRLVQYAAKHAEGVPIVAIGGVTVRNAAAAIAAGASAVAVISDLLVGDPERRVRAFVDALATGPR